MHCFPIVGWHHLDRVPRTSVEKRAIGTFANTFLTTYTEIWVDFNSPEWRMIFIRDPKHARFDWTVFNAGWRSGATGTAVCGDCENARSLFASRFPVSLGHGPVLFYDVIHGLMFDSGVYKLGGPLCKDPPSLKYHRYARDSNIALPISSTICVGSITHLPILHRRVKTNHGRKTHGNRFGNFPF